jgi:catechol 2,3-dioxygenase-like lactoylglutathione lyase family enzyme
MFRRRAVAALLFALVASRSTPAQERPSAAAADVPVVGLAGITFRVSDLDKARAYYNGVLGLPVAFTVKDRNGATSVFYKINDDQYVETIGDLKAGEINRQARIMIQSSDLKRLNALYTERGLNPSPIMTGPDGNPVFRVIGPDDAKLDFIQYVPGSQQSALRGKMLDPRRITTHLWHVGIYTKDRATVAPFYEQKLGFARGRDLPGGRGEYLETPSSDRNIETKYPPLDPNDPATRPRYEREVMGAVQHMGIEVADMRATRDLVQERGKYTDLQVRAHVGNNRHWLMHVFDPDGSRTEILETAVQPDSVPSMSVMAPGKAVAPPIVPTTPGVIPWP